MGNWKRAKGVADYDDEARYGRYGFTITPDFQTGEHSSDGPKRRVNFPRRKFLYEFQMKQAEPKQQYSGSPSWRTNAVLIEDSSVKASTITQNDTQVERLKMRVGDKYVTILRYDGNNDHIAVNVNNGRIVTTDMDGLDDVVEGLLE